MRPSHLSPEELKQHIAAVIENMPATPLYDSALLACSRHIDEIKSVGEAPYHKVACILKLIRRPEQLRQIEVACPQIDGETGELWRNFIKEDIPKWQTKVYQPDDSKLWWKVYEGLKTQEDEAIARDELAFQLAYDVIQAEKKQHEVKIIEPWEMANFGLQVPAGARANPSKAATPGSGSGATRTQPVPLSITGSAASSAARVMKRALPAPKTSGKKFLEKTRRQLKQQKAVQAVNERYLAGRKSQV
ncbi:MAG: hypothetical protein M1826_000453 [Phylliscum demangeonii]|nr:MAG: hypothetical protein M1826_000453 [Phylliscum demangeonii]